MSSQGTAVVKAPIKLNTIFNSEGVEVEVEARDDDEEKQLLQKIIDLFLTAGYYRANFKELTSFDKVTGGMIWCIIASNINIGFPTGYGEQLNIKKKISVSESIIEVLLSNMKCPIILHPHQISGLDVHKLYPLTKWIVDQCSAYKMTVNNLLKDIDFSNLNISSDFLAYSASQQTSDILLKYILSVMAKYVPSRVYKRKGPTISLKHLESIPCEYMNIVYKQNEGAAIDPCKYKEFLTDVYPADQFESIAIITKKDKQSHYDLLNEEFSLSTEEAEIQQLTETKARQEVVLESLKTEKSALEADIHEIKSHIEEKKSGIEHFRKEFSSIEENETKKREYEIIQTIIDETKSLREEYSRLVAQNLEMGSMDDGFEETDLSSSFNEEDHNESIEEILAASEQVRLKTSEESQKVITLEMDMEEPEAAELAMYQKRFNELYDVVAANTIETKQFYDMYNTLIDEKNYIMKEINLYNSILDNYQRAMSSANYREQFFGQLENVAEWLKQTSTKVSQRFIEKKMIRDTLGKEWSQLMEAEREYIRVISKYGVEVSPKHPLHPQRSFKIPLHTSLDMVEQLLETCAAPAGLSPEDLHPVCVAMLKLTYLQHTQLCLRLREAAGSNESNISRFRVLTASAVLLASVRLHSGARAARHLARLLSTCVHIAPADLAGLADIIVTLALE